MDSARRLVRIAVPLVIAGALVVANGAYPAAAQTAKPTISGMTAASGPTTGGIRITVRGTNFAHVTAVTFGGVKGTSLKASVTHKSLLITAPPHAAGGVVVRVTTTAGTSALTSKDAFDYQTYASISASGYHSCAISSGSVRCWGGNADGQLGNGTTTDAHTPVKVLGLTHAVAVSGGYAHTCALRSDGTVWCWGVNDHGQLGKPMALALAKAPIKVPGLAHVVAIKAAFYQTCALVADGTAWCWGDNASGELGNGTTLTSVQPVKVKTLTHLIALTANYLYTCALTSDGAVFCWGHNNYGQLGNGTLNEAHSPVRVIGVTHATDLSAGYAQACAVVAGGLVRCWGYNVFGQLGNGTLTDSRVSVAVAGLTESTKVSVGEYYVCALVRGQTFCWGDNSHGQLGNGDTATNERTASAVAGLGSTTELSVGDYHVCARVKTGLRCWGANDFGDLGNNSTTDSSLPVPVG